MSKSIEISFLLTLLERNDSEVKNYVYGDIKSKLIHIYRKSWIT